MIEPLPKSFSIFFHHCVKHFELIRIYLYFFCHFVVVPRYLNFFFLSFLLPHPVQRFHLVGALVGFRAARHREADYPASSNRSWKGLQLLTDVLPIPQSPVRLFRSCGYFCRDRIRDSSCCAARSCMARWSLRRARRWGLPPPQPLEPNSSGEASAASLGRLRLGRKLGRKFCRGHAREACCELLRRFRLLRRGFPWGFAQAHARVLPAALVPEAARCPRGCLAASSMPAKNFMPVVGWCRPYL